MQKRYFLPIMALLLTVGTNSWATKVIYGNPSGGSASVSVPASYVGMTASFIATGYGYQGMSNMEFSMTLYHPSGAELMTSTSFYVTAGGSPAADMFPFLYTGTISQAGTYSFQLGNTTDQKKIMSFLCIVWDAQGDDITNLQTQLNVELNDLRNELLGVLNTKTAELQNQINSLQAQLNEAIAKHNTDQAALLKQIQDFKSEINNLTADLQYNVARLERAQAEYLAQLEILKTTYQKDAEMLNLKIGNLDSKYATEVANLKANVSKIANDLAAMDAKFLAADQQLKTLIASLEKDQTALQQQLNLAEQKHKTDVAAIQTQIDSKTELIRTEHAADVKRLENSISTVDSTYEAEVARLNTEQSKLSSQLTQAVKDYTAADAVLQGKIDKLSTEQIGLQNELADLTTAHSRDVAEINRQIEAKATEQTALHNADVKLLEQKISDLESRFESSAANLSSELAKTNQNLVQAIRDSNSADSALLEKINTLTATQSDLQNQQDTLERNHTRDLTELNTRLADLKSTLEVQHAADVKLLDQKIGTANDLHQNQVDTLTSELNQTNTKLTQAIRDSNATDETLLAKIDSLTTEQTTLQNQLESLQTEHVRDVAALEKQIAAQKETLTAGHDADVKALEKSIADLKDRYQTTKDALTAELARTNTQLTQAIRDSNTADEALQAKLDRLSASQTSTQTQLDTLNTEHTRDIAELKTQIADKNAALEAKHAADVNLLNQKISNLDSRYETTAASLIADLSKTNAQLVQMGKDYRAGDAALKGELDTLKQQQLSLKNELALQESNHTQAVAALRKDADAQYAALESTHNADIALLNQKIAAQNSTYADKVAALTAELEQVNSDLAQAIRNVNTTDEALQAKIERMAAAQASTQTQLDTLSTAHTRDIAELKTQIADKNAALEAKHTADVNLLNQKISDLDSRYETTAASLTADLSQTNTKLAQAEKDYLAGDATLKSELDTLKQQQLSLKNELALQESSHTQAVVALRKDADAQYAALESTHNSDVALLNQKIAAQNSTYADKMETLTTTLNKTNAELTQAIRDFNTADEAIKAKIDNLNASQTSTQAQLDSLNLEHTRDIAALQTQIADKVDALDVKHTAAENLLNQKISDLNGRYESSTASLTADLNRTNAKLEEMEKAYQAGDETLKTDLDELKQQQLALKNEITLQETRLNQEIAVLREKSTAQYEQLEATHAADVNLLNSKIAAQNAVYADKVAVLTTELSKTNADLAQAIRNSDAADEALKEKLDSLSASQTTTQAQLDALSTAHTRDVAELNTQIANKIEALDTKHTAAENLLNQKISDLNSRYETSVATLTVDLTSTDTKLAQTEKAYQAADAALKAELDTLKQQQLTLKNELALQETSHTQEIAALKKDADTRYTLLENTHAADVNLLNRKIAEQNAVYADKVAALTTELSKTNADLAQAIRNSEAADEALKEKLDSLSASQTATQTQLDALSTEHTRDVAELKTQIADKIEALDTKHTAAENLLNQKISDLNSRYETSVATLTADLTSTNTKLAQAEKAYQAADTALKAELDTLKQQQLTLKNELALQETSHTQEIAALKKDADSRYALLENTHAADVNLLNRKIAELNGTYADKVAALTTELNQTNSELAQLAKDSAAGDKELQQKIDTLTTQQTTQRNELSQLEQKQEQDTATLRAATKAKYEQLEAAYQTDTALLNQKIAEINSNYADKVAALNTALDKTNSTLTQLAKDTSATDVELRTKIDTLITQQVEQKNALLMQEQKHDQEIEQLRAEAKAKYDQLESEYNADLNLLNQRISVLNTTYEDKVSAIQNELDATNSTLSQLARETAARDKELQEKIDTLNAQQVAQKNALALLQTEHSRDVAALRAESTAKVEQLQAAHEADVRVLTQQLANVNATYADKVSQINNKLDSIGSDLSQMARDYTNGDKELKEQIDTLRLQQLTQQNTLANLKEAHAKDMAALQKELSSAQEALQEKIDTEIADLRQEMLAIDNKYKDSVADLKNQLAAVNSKLDGEIAKLSAADRDLYDKISDLREKQADYYARMEILKIAHEKDKEALEKEIADLDAKYKEEVEAIHTKIAVVKEDISKLQTQHDRDVAELQRRIDDTVKQLDEEVRKIYLELDDVRQELETHRKSTQLAIDNLQLQMTELDKSVTERLLNLENRIQYATYSDEKLEALLKEFKTQIQAKEKEIADLDLEIKDLEEAGLDTSAKQATRVRLLTELLKLRNELTDIEFAIEIRHNESEFAEHEKEIALLKGELAALRNSSELQIKQLKDELLATEAKYLKLLEEAKVDAANQSAAIQKQLDDLTGKVLAFVDALRRERAAGDAELKTLLEALDASHQTLIADLEKSLADKLEKMKFETDTQFENLRSTINNIAYQQRTLSGSGNSGYSLPNSQTQDIPTDSRDLRVSPDSSLNPILN